MPGPRSRSGLERCRWCPRGGTASMPVREKGQERPACPHPVRSRVPFTCQTAAKRRRPSHARPLLTAEKDSPQEETGFEPSVPLSEKGLSAVAERRCRTDKLDGSLSTGRLPRRRWLGAGPLSTAVSLTAGPMVRIRLPPAVSQANFRIPPLARPDLDASAPMKRRVPPAGWRYALVPLSRIGERVRVKLLGE